MIPVRFFLLWSGSVTQGHTEQDRGNSCHEQFDGDQGADQPEAGPWQRHVEQDSDQEGEDPADGEKAPTSGCPMTCCPESAADSREDQAACEDGCDED